ncbi:MAG: LysR family transcriptional regulator [Rhodobacteraceae bacterium GWE1_64_9]|jgi:DNA-binding transcriptional LysR family regulator|nr:MAG: LysR family transcriptional regulator [Rhodobacteraceae bacterium GWE1_64_9]|tara:strand:+ start:21916 stop:22833 length:918 start_codon:yes stop_codon:yes gene_type:complete
MLSSEDFLFFGVIARSGSLADASRRLNVSAPAVTQRLKALERRVGVRLIDRSLRGLTLTDEGELLAAEGAAIVDVIEQLDERLGRRSTTVRGKLRIAAPYGFGREFVAAAVSEFVQLYPEATVALELSDHPASLSSDSWDVVIHIGALNSTNRLVTTLAPNRRIVCASPTYLQDNPAIKKPEDLQHCRCLALRENDEDVTLWRFSRPKCSPETIRIKPFMSTNDGAIMRSWALAGLGVIMRSEWDLADDLASGSLVQILSDWRAPDADVVALLSARDGRSRRITAFLEIMRGHLHPVPWRVPAQS